MQVRLAGETDFAGFRKRARRLLGADVPPETVQWSTQAHNEDLFAAGGEDAFDGRHYRLGRTLSSPPNLSVPRPRLMIGGSGERKWLRLVARYADACNLFGGPESAHKLDVLRAHCETESRDYDSIEKTTIVAPSQLQR